MSRWLLGTLPVMSLLIVGVMLLLTSCGKKEETAPREVLRPVKMMTIAAGDQVMKRTFPGRVSAAQNVDLSFKVSGPLIELPVNEGQVMKKGQIIARILPRDFQTAQAQAQARALEAEQQYQRYRDLFIQKQVSKADFDKYKSARDIAKAQEDDARHALEDTYLRAPFAGAVAKKFVDNFEDVRAKEPIVSLQDTSSIEIRINVPESVMASIKEAGSGTAVAEFAAAPGKQYQLSLKEYSTAADPQTQTYRVTFLMPQPEDLTVLPGMTASVLGSRSVHTEATDRIIIPAVAVFADEGGLPQVWVVDKETSEVKRRQVSTGNLTGTDSILITNGIEPGETIAVSGVSQLRQGMKVRPLNE